MRPDIVNLISFPFITLSSWDTLSLMALNEVLTSRITNTSSIGLPQLFETIIISDTLDESYI